MSVLEREKNSCYTKWEVCEVHVFYLKQFAKGCQWSDLNTNVYLICPWSSQCLLHLDGVQLWLKNQ